MKFEIVAHSRNTFGRADALPGVSIAKFKTREAADKRAYELNVAKPGSFYHVHEL